MSQINNEGVEKLRTVKNALNSMYNKLDKSEYDNLQEEFNFISSTISDAITSWERVDTLRHEDNVRTVVINGKTYKAEGV